MEETKKGNWLIVLLLLIIFAVGGFIVYDKVLNQEKNTCEECIEKVVDYNRFDVETNVPLVCTIDMEGLTEANVFDKCGEDFDINNDSYQIKVSNINYKDTKLTYTYILEKDTFFPREEVGIVKTYIGSTMVDAHDGTLRQIFYNIKVNGDKLEISETTRSDVPRYESSIDLNKIVK